MRYDLSKASEVAELRRMVERAIERKLVVEFGKRREPRTLAQNRYLHVLLSCFALETGHTAAEAKGIFKDCNADIFRKDGAVRSSADLSSDEMSSCIERFKVFAASELGIYLPPATNEAEAAVERELGRNRKFMYEDR